MREFEHAIAELLTRPRYEVIPLDGIEEKVLEHVPRDVKLTVTASPTKGLGPTLDLVERFAAESYDVVPHLSARLILDDGHLRWILARLHEAGIGEVFVVAGDASQPAGQFEGAAALLRAMVEHRHEISEVGITGYPESHPLIDDETTIQAMFEKAEFATHIVSQICFDPRVTVQWIENVWTRGTRLPIYVGIAGPISTTRLLRASSKIGIGDSARFLRKHGSLVGRLLLPGAYSPDKLIRGLEPALVDPARRVAGFHVFTFNEVEATERWRRSRLEELGTAAPAVKAEAHTPNAVVTEEALEDRPPELFSTRAAFRTKLRKEGRLVEIEAPEDAPSLEEVREMLRGDAGRAVLESLEEDRADR